MPPEPTAYPAPSFYARHHHHLLAVLLLALVFVGSLTLGLFLVQGTLRWLDAGQLVVIGAPVGLLLGLYEVYVFPRSRAGPWPCAFWWG